jgi:SulP family sulfate permease
LHIDESLFFDNQSVVEAKIAGGRLEQSKLRHVVPVISAVNRVNTTAMKMLCDTSRDLAGRGVRLYLAKVEGPPLDRQSRSRLWPMLPVAAFLSVNAAFEKLRAADFPPPGPCA